MYAHNNNIIKILIFTLCLFSFYNSVYTNYPGHPVKQSGSAYYYSNTDVKRPQLREDVSTGTPDNKVKTYLVSIKIGDHIWCSGAALSKLYVLAPAHCSSYVVKYGSNIIEAINANVSGQTRKVDIIFRHSSYLTTMPPLYDLSLIKLRDGFDKELISFVPLTGEGAEDAKLAIVNVTGYGTNFTTSANYSANEEPFSKIEMLVRSDSYCVSAFMKSQQIIFSEFDYFCATIPEDQINNDSAPCSLLPGAPATVDGELVGMLVLGPQDCDDLDFVPFVFSRISSHRSFLLQHLLADICFVGNQGSDTEISV